MAELLVVLHELRLLLGCRRGDLVFLYAVVAEEQTKGELAAAQGEPLGETADGASEEVAAGVAEADLCLPEGRAGEPWRPGFARARACPLTTRSRRSCSRTKRHSR